MKRLEELFHEVMEWGTPQCGIFWGIVGIVVALLLLFVGFWKTLFVAVLFAVGLFFGGVKDKTAFIKNLINRIFPPRQNG
jgi:uncharacterized membrane protein